MNYSDTWLKRVWSSCLRSMLPVEAVKEYNLSLFIPKHKMHKKMKRECITQVEKEMMQIKYKELVDQKLEAYRTGRTGDHHFNFGLI